MGSVFNVYRSGYRLGVADGMAGRRRRPDWELWLLRPVNWLPGVDAGSFAAGYAEGWTKPLRGATTLPSAAIP